MEQKRCEWVKSKLDILYHDDEWGKPLHDDAMLFEMLMLEGMQAGLSWSTVLKKRDYMRTAFDGFDAEIIAGYGEEKMAELLDDPGIIRNRLKLHAMIRGAREFLRLQKEYGSFDKYIWQFVNHQPIRNSWQKMKDVPVSTPQSDAMSKALKAEGFKFVGSTICYAYMQATGMVNDHMVWCPQYHECESR